ncbi:MAG: aminotransferase class I/II-fold pyridoxal phosphate-dependent enzyme [Betaproteobacteria bacterium]|jgi:aspartate aminotransferase|nr:aminotransferase class I/II-fold pyridoxal phosphate-dependent enzyme [Betaproteobacteria bacterium]MDH5343078.1 aminotransferase class I/II-fold pyridoxal phosphate-dependent enzyme [Betaproteobacteria bacterium]
MIEFSERLSRIKLSPSNVAAQKVRDLRAAGRDVIGLMIGEPDFETPPHVKRAVVAAMDRNETRYTPINGIPQLREAVRNKFIRENGLDFSAEQVMAGTGSKQILFNALQATVGPGDEVIIPAPYWISYLDMTLVADGTPVVVTCGIDRGFKLTPEQLEAAITPRTKWLLLNSPGNPSGAIYSREELLALAEVLRRHPQVWVLSDDIYEHLRFDGVEFCTMAQVAPDLADRTLTVNGVSKAYAMTGFRLGYAAGPLELIRAMVKMQSQSTAGVNSLSQWAAVEALNGPQEFLAERAAAFQERRDHMLELLREVPGLTCDKPQGAFYLFPRCAGLLGRKTPDGKVLEKEVDVVVYLLEHAGVAVVQGEAYGLSPYMRISIASSLDNLTEAGRRIARAVAELR